MGLAGRQGEPDAEPGAGPGAEADARAAADPVAATGERGVPGLDLSRLDAVVSDMDGVLWRGAETLPGVPELFGELRRRGVRLAFATNNSGKAPGEYVARLLSIGVPEVVEHEVITSGVVTAAYLRDRYPAGAAVHVLGNPGLKTVIAEAGFALAGDDGPAGVVVASIDSQLTYDKLARAAALIMAGAEFIGTNGDPNVPSAGGALPGSGSVVAALETATGRRARLMGKPEAAMFDLVLEVLGTTAERTLMIGDRLDTDILGARRRSLRTALVLSGASGPADLTRAAALPDLVSPGLPELLAALTLRPAR